VLARTREMVKASLPRIYRGLVRDAVEDGIDPVDRHRASKMVMQAAGEIHADIQVTQTTTVLQIPERLAQHLESRREMLREVAVIDPAGGNGNGNGHSD
jgi:hypothetical protein